jgi:methionyl-tRNA formyltransferase
MTKALNIIFAGTPDFAAQHLAELIQSEHRIVAVYCPPDKPSGRGKKLTACATKTLALEHSIAVEQPVNFKNPDDQKKLAHYKADVMVVVAYGLLLPISILETPRLGCINVHGSLLPKWRGAAPIQRALEAGDAETGVTIMQMDKGLDTGDMLLKVSCAIEQEDTSVSLYEKLAKLGPKALIKALSLMATNSHSSQQQDNSQATYAAKLNKAESEIDWQLSASVLHQKLRAYIPWPVAQFTFTDDNDKQHRIKVWQASVVDQSEKHQAGKILKVDKSGITVATGKNALRLEMLQLPNKKALPCHDVINGRPEWFMPNNAINGKET